ncbi:MFS transporter, partial [Candidatus Bathyarchaeota archaeon]
MPRKVGLRMVLYLYVAVFLTRIGFGSITILFPLYLQAPSYIIGVILALYPMSEAGSALPIGRLADRSSRKNLHIIGMIMITILTAAIGFTRNLLNVSILHAMMGISAAITAVTSLTLLGDATKLTNRGKQMGGFDLANLGGYGLGFGVGGLLVNSFADRLSYAFWITAGVFLFAGILAAKFLVEPVRVWELKQPKIRQRRIGSRIRPVIPVWIAQTVILGMYFLLPKAFRDSNPPIILTRETLIFLGVLGGLFAFGAILFGYISDKIGRTRIMVLGAFGELGFLVLFGWSFPGNGFVKYELLLWPMFFLASAIAPAILAYVGDISGKAKRGSANALYSIVLSIGLAIGNI